MCANLKVQQINMQSIIKDKTFALVSFICFVQNRQWSRGMEWLKRYVNGREKRREEKKTNQYIVSHVKTTFRISQTEKNNNLT